MSPQSSEQPHKQPLKESKSWALISIFSSASLRAAGIFQTSIFLNPSFSFLCPPPLFSPTPQPRTPKLCFCTVWRKPTTSCRCSSRTQECLHCPTARRSKFRCASARRTRCTAVQPTPTASVYSRCSGRSCSSYSVSITEACSTSARRSWKSFHFPLLTSPPAFYRSIVLIIFRVL